MTKTVCIIGAGASGLTAIKSSIEYNLNVTCYESSNVLGGIWATNVTKNTVANSSKEHSSFSDFPPPSEYPLFMNQQQMRKYLEAYAIKFNLYKYILFGHKVTSIEQIDGKNNKKWLVTVTFVDGSNASTNEFDAILLCTGNNQESFIPDITGLKDTFTGSIIHSGDLYDLDSNGKEKINPGDKVIIIGGANSAGDAAVWCADRTNEPVVMLVKSIPWVIPRRGVGGRPFDEILNCRFNRAKLSLIPSNFLANYFSQYLIESIYFDHKLYCGGVKPSHGIFDDQGMINDVLPLKMLTGNVKLIQFKSLVKFNSRSLDVLLEDGSKLTSFPCDKVVFATGFKNHLTHKIMSQLLNEIPNCEKVKLSRNDKSNYPLYKHMYLPEIGYSFAIIGSVSPLGPLFPIVELQSRWACGLIATNGLGNKYIKSLPSVESMKLIIRRDIDNQPKASTKANLVDWMHYIDDIASQVSSKPSFVSLLFTDPLAWYHTFCGPCYSYQFRLNDYVKSTINKSNNDDKYNDDNLFNNFNDDSNIFKSIESIDLQSIDTDVNTNTLKQFQLPIGMKSKCEDEKIILEDEKQMKQFKQMSPRVALLSAKDRIEDAFKYH